MTPKKWQLLSKKDVSPHKWLPVEMRSYRHPSGKIIDDFSVVTLADVAMVVPITKDKKVVLVNQYKPGADSLTLEFPAGRWENNSLNFLSLAQHELEEEVGIRVEVSQLTYFATLNGFTTKGSEKVFFYFASDLEFNSNQHLDENEDIEVIQLSFQEMDSYIFDGKILSSQTIAGWELAKKHFPQVFKTSDRE